MKLTTVAAGVLRDISGRILLAERPLDKSMSGFWEFPGGKLEGSETPEQALIRELKEELRINALIKDLKPLTFITHRYPDFNLLMLVYVLNNWTGQPMSAENQRLSWVAKEDLRKYKMLPADEPIISILLT